MMDLPKFGTTSRGWSSKHPKTRTFAVAAGEGHRMRPAWRVCRPMAWSSKGRLVIASR